MTALDEAVKSVIDKYNHVTFGFTIKQEVATVINIQRKLFNRISDLGINLDAPIIKKGGE